MEEIGDDVYINDEEWPMCPVHGCENRICLSLGSRFCYPHSIVKEPFEKLIERSKVKVLAQA